MALPYRPEIDGLRALAVVPVVLFHAGIAGFGGGYVGVDVFFVISGYLITATIRHEAAAGTFTVVGFYERRARRILPALFVVLLATLTAGYVVQTPTAFATTGREALAATLFVSNLYYLDEFGYFQTAADLRPLLHTWSLAVEEQFYLLWPLVVAGVAVRRGRASGVGGGRGGVRAVGAVAVAVFALSLALGVAATPRFPEASFYLLPTRAWELMVGALLALGLVPAIRPRAARETAALAGLGALLAAVALYDRATPFPGVAALLPCLGAGLVIHAGGATRVARLLALRPLVFVGLVSYSFYLWHWPPLALARIVTGSTTLSPALGAALVLGAFGAAVLSWRFVERPFRDRRRLGRRPLFALSGAALAGLAALSLATSATDGFPARYDATALALERDATVAGDGRDYCDLRLPRDGLCRIGRLDGPPTVLLWGDSHAGAMIAAADLALGAADRAGVAAIHNGCLPLPGARRTAGSGSCVAFTGDVLAMLAAPGSRIDTVVITGRWALSVQGERVAGEAGEAVRLVAGDGIAGSNEEIVRRALAGLVDRLTARGIRVVLVGGVPEIGWNVAERALMETRIDLPDLAAPTLAEVATRNLAVDDILGDLAQRDKVDFVPIAPLLCRPRCATVVDGRPLYRDDDHVSFYAASRIIGPALERALFPDAAATPGRTVPLRTERRPLYFAGIAAPPGAAAGDGP